MIKRKKTPGPFCKSSVQSNIYRLGHEAFSKFESFPGIQNRYIFASHFFFKCGYGERLQTRRKYFIQAVISFLIYPCIDRKILRGCRKSILHSLYKILPALWLQSVISLFFSRNCAVCFGSEVFSAAAPLAVRRVNY